MAIDTAAKRGSAINPGSPWRSHLPFPDGTIGQGDRQAVAFWYTGILAEGAASENGTPCPTFHARPRPEVYHTRPRPEVYHGRAK